MDDLVDAMIRLMNAAPDVSGPLNLGNPREITIRELANTILDLTGSKSELVYEPLPSDDPVQRCPDIERTEQTLDWSPTTSFRAGLTQTIEYSDSLLSKQI